MSQASRHSGLVAKSAASRSSLGGPDPVSRPERVGHAPPSHSSLSTRSMQQRTSLQNQQMQEQMQVAASSTLEHGPASTLPDINQGNTPQRPQSTPGHRSSKKSSSSSHRKGPIKAFERTAEEMLAQRSGSSLKQEGTTPPQVERRLSSHRRSNSSSRRRLSGVDLEGVADAAKQGQKSIDNIDINLDLKQVQMQKDKSHSLSRTELPPEQAKGLEGATGTGSRTQTLSKMQLDNISRKMESPGRSNQTAMSQRNISGENLASQKSSQLNQGTTASIPKIVRKGPKRQNQFKVNKMNHQEVIGFLFDMCGQNVILNEKLVPQDLDSTQAIDSFLKALLYIATNNVQKKDVGVLEKLHLSTGTRTAFCHEIINFMIKHQSKETIFIDAVEFFQESLEHMLKLEEENAKNKKDAGELLNAKQDLTMKVFDLQYKLRETSSSLLKLRQREHEQSVQFAETRQVLEAKKAECESLHYRLKALGQGVSTSADQTIKQGAGVENATTLENNSVQLRGSTLSNLSASRPQQAQDVPQGYHQAAASRNYQSSATQTDHTAAIEQETVLTENELRHVQGADRRVQDIQRELEAQVRAFAAQQIEKNDEPAFQGACFDFQRLQVLLNQIRIENKNLTTLNASLTTRISNKDRLVTHLENKVTELLLKSEESSLDLKAEITDLKRQQDQNEQNLKESLAQMREKVEKECREDFKEKMTQLQEDTEKYKRENTLMQEKSSQISDNFKTLQKEFTQYRSNKDLDEKKRESYVSEVEGKLHNFYKTNLQTKESLTDRIRKLENHCDKKHKENQILFLRLKYMRQTSDVLLRQKTFLADTLGRAHQELEQKMNELHSSMLSQNKNSSYLVSVEKAVKQSQHVADISKSALNDVVKIVKFLKIEKMHKLIFETEELSPGLDDNGQAIGGTHDQNKQNKQSARDIVSSDDAESQREERFSPDGIQFILDDLKNTMDLPVNLKPRSNTESKSRTLSPHSSGGGSRARSEEYMLEHNQNELISILLKCLVDQLVRIEAVKSVEHIPQTIGRLLFLANNKTENSLEREIFDHYLKEAFQTVVQDTQFKQQQIEALDQIRVLGGQEEPKKESNSMDEELEERSSFAETSKSNDNKKKQSSQENVEQTPSRKSSRNPSMLEQSRMIISQEQEKAKRQSAEMSKQNRETKDKDIVKLDSEIKILQMQLKDAKMMEITVQKGLAEKIVKLEETNDFLKEDFEERLSSAEFSYRQELEQIKLAAIQREKQLIRQLEELRERNQRLEMAHLRESPHDNGSTLYHSPQKKHSLFDNRKGSTAKNRGHSRMSSQKSHSQLNRSKSVLSIGSKSAENENKGDNSEDEDENSNDQNDPLQTIEDYEAYAENVKEYLSIREATHGTISLVFEAQEANNSMISEDMLAFYLGKVFEIPKHKLRFLQKHYFVQQNREMDAERLQRENKLLVTSQAPLEMVKITIQVVQDIKQFRASLAEFRTEVREGSSLLYDLQPAYVTINLGHSGLATKASLNQCQLICKKGCNIGGNDYIVSVLRNTKSAYSFMLTLIGFAQGEEYCLELSDADIFWLTEGDMGMLHDAEPERLLDLIVSNLALYECDHVVHLTCEHKVFFNSLWQGIVDTKTTLQAHKLQPESSKYSTKFPQQSGVTAFSRNTEGEAYAQSAVREQTILSQEMQQPAEYHLKGDGIYTELIQAESACQTDFETNLLFDQQIVVYKGIQKLSTDVKIELEVKQSLQEELVLLNFIEKNSNASAKFSIFNRLPVQNLQGIQSQSTSTHESGAEFEQRTNTNLNQEEAQPQGQYLMHSEALSVGKEHLVLVSIERVQNDGLFVKLQDLKLMTTDQFYLVRKSNGHFTRLNPSPSLKLTYQEEFRNLVFDLAFTTESALSNEVLQQNLAYSQDKMQGAGKNPADASKELLQGGLPASSHVRKIVSFTAEALLKTSEQNTNNQEISQWRGLQQKGLLLYRDIKRIRCNMGPMNNSEMRNKSQSSIISISDLSNGGVLSEAESLITLYLKEGQVNIEVFLFKDKDKMSITSNVMATEIFDQDPISINYARRMNLLNQMLDRLFVIQSEGAFHMKVENDAIPMSQILEAKAMKEQSYSEYMTGSALKRKQQSEIAHEEKIREFSMEKSTLVSNGKAKKFDKYIPFNNQLYEIRVYIVLKTKKIGIKQSSKRLNTIGKTHQQVEQQKIEIFMDEFSEFEQVYIEMQHTNDNDILQLLLERKSLAQILTKDITCDWKQLLQFWDTSFIDYIYEHIQFDFESRKLTIFNKKDISQLLKDHCRQMTGGQIMRRKDNLIVDGFEPEHHSLLNKAMVLNQEVDFTEVVYDIKLFKISAKSPYGDQVEVSMETLAYHLEIYDLNQPEVIYKHRIPVQQTSVSMVNDPLSLITDVFNLIDSPMNSSSTSEDQEESRLNSLDSGVNDKAKSSSKHQTKNAPGTSPSKKQQSTLGDNDKTDRSGNLQESTRYQALFKKYIDNQLVLVVQESKFPASLSFSLVEPSSRLSWKCTYEPSTELVSPSSFSVVDPGSIETFLTIVYDQMNEDLLSAQGGTITSILSNPETAVQHSGSFAVEADQTEVLSSFKVKEGPLVSVVREFGKPVIIVKQEEDSKEANAEEKDQDDLPQQSELDPNQSSPPFNAFKMLIQKSRGAYLNAKIINLDDSAMDGSQVKGLCLVYKSSVSYFSVSLISLAELRCLYRFVFEHSNPASDDIHLTAVDAVSPIHKMGDATEHVLDAVKNLFSEHTHEHILSNYLRLLESQGQLKNSESRKEATHKYQVLSLEELALKVQRCPAHQQRYYQRNFNQIKTVTLHRKIVFDETLDRLIVINADVSFKQGDQRQKNPMLLDSQIESFQFKIVEPQFGAVTTMDVLISSCVSKRQFEALHRSDLMKLKSLARVVLEDRSIIRRQDANANQQSTSSLGKNKNQGYSLEIVPLEDQQVIDLPGNEDALEMGQSAGQHQMDNDENDLQNEGYSPGNTNRMDLYENEDVAGERDLQMDMEMDADIQNEAMQLNLEQMQNNGNGNQHDQRQHHPSADQQYEHFDEMESASIEPGIVAEEQHAMNQVQVHTNSDQRQTNGRNSVILEEASQEDREMDGNSSAKLLQDQSRFSGGANNSQPHLSLGIHTQSVDTDQRNQPDLSPQKSNRSKESTRLQDATGNAVPGGTFIL